MSEWLQNAYEWLKAAFYTETMFRTYVLIFLFFIYYELGYIRRLLRDILATLKDRPWK